MKSLIAITNLAFTGLFITSCDQPSAPDPKAVEIDQEAVEKDPF
ncbi:MAG: hypothetical protein ACI8UO_003366 [Verrucomicrobiales bacterium]|jgi:hypothetical protein